MKIKEMLELIEQGMRMDENFLDFDIIMVGYDKQGHREHTINISDITMNFDDEIIRLWN